MLRISALQLSLTPGWPRVKKVRLKTMSRWRQIMPAKDQALPARCMRYYMNVLVSTGWGIYMWFSTIQDKVCCYMLSLSRELKLRSKSKIQPTLKPSIANIITVSIINIIWFGSQMKNSPKIQIQPKWSNRHNAIPLANSDNIYIRSFILLLSEIAYKGNLDSNIPIISLSTCSGNSHSVPAIL